MKIIYTTLNNEKEAEKIGNILLRKKLCNCVNFFPIQAIYNFEEKIQKETETILLIKTKDGMFAKIEKVIKENINYDNFIGEISIENVNKSFKKWLNSTVK